MKKYITVAIPNYNHSFRLEKVINSVINQTLSNDKYEILVIDDGSTDNSLEILDKFKGKIRLIVQKNKGLSLTRGELIKNVSKNTTHIYFLDADDTMTPEILEEHYKHVINEDFFVSADIQLWENGRKRHNSWDVYKNSNYSIIYTTATSKLWKIEDARDAIWPAGIKNEDDFAYPMMLKNKSLSFINPKNHLNVLNEPKSLSKRKNTSNAKKIIDLALASWEINDRNISLLIHSVSSEGAWKYLRCKMKEKGIKIPSPFKRSNAIGWKRVFADFWTNWLTREKNENFNNK